MQQAAEERGLLSSQCHPREPACYLENDGGPHLAKECGKLRFRGVSQDPAGRWEAYMYHYRRKIYLGNWETALDAARAHDMAVISVFGPNALTLNFPVTDYAKDLEVLQEGPARKVIDQLRKEAKARRRGPGGDENSKEGVLIRLVTPAPCPYPGNFENSFQENSKAFHLPNGWTPKESGKKQTAAHQRVLAAPPGCCLTLGRKPSSSSKRPQGSQRSEQDKRRKARSDVSEGFQELSDSEKSLQSGGERSKQADSFPQVIDNEEIATEQVQSELRPRVYKPCARYPAGGLPASLLEMLCFPPKPSVKGGICLATCGRV